MNKVIALIIVLFPFFSIAAEHETIYKGTYTWGPEVHSFKPCNDKNDYWVSFDWAGIEMHEFYKKKARSYQLMYIEFRGQILDEVVDGFADQYAGLIRVSEVKKYTFDLPNQCV
jgi:hypothetical protein